MPTADKDENSNSGEPNLIIALLFLAAGLIFWRVSIGSIYAVLTSQEEPLVKAAMLVSGLIGISVATIWLAFPRPMSLISKIMLGVFLSGLFSISSVEFFYYTITGVLDREWFKPISYVLLLGILLIWQLRRNRKKGNNRKDHK